MTAPASARVRIPSALVGAVLALVALAAVAFVAIPILLLGAADELQARARALEAEGTRNAREAVAHVMRAHVDALTPELARWLDDPLAPRGPHALYVDGVRVVPAPDACPAEDSRDDDDTDLESLVRAVEGAIARPAALRAAVITFLVDEANHRRRADRTFLARARVLEALSTSGQGDGDLLRSLVFGRTPAGPETLESLHALLLRARPFLCGGALEDAVRRTEALTLATGGSFAAVGDLLALDAAGQFFPARLQVPTTGELWLGDDLALVSLDAGRVVAWRVHADDLAGLALARVARGFSSSVERITIPTVAVPTPVAMLALDVVDVRTRQRLAEAASVRAMARLAVGAVAAAAVLVLALGAWVLSRARREGGLRRDLVTAVTHELRTPLASMRLQLDALERRSLEPRTEQALARLGRDVDSLEGLVENVLGYGRLSRGGVVLVRSHVGLLSLCREVAEALQGQMPREPSAPAIVLVSGDDLEAWVDPELIRMVLSNLIGNAIKHNPSAQAVVRVVVQEHSGGLRVRVEDNGVGIAEDDRGRIFRPFERSMTLSRGAGLGLTLAQQIARLHGGDVTLASSGPSGSVFVLDLPAPESRA